MTLLEAARKLRNAQKAYMANRGNVELGKAVALAAKDVDYAIDAIERGDFIYIETTHAEFQEMVKAGMKLAAKINAP